MTERTNSRLDGTGVANEDLQFLDWAGMTLETWKNKEIFITSEGFRRLSNRPRFDYEPILYNPANPQMALRRISFEHAKILWEMKDKPAIMNLEDLRMELARHEGFTEGYNLITESELIWEHEMAHDQEGRQFGVESRLFVFNADEESYMAGLVNNIASLRRQVAGGLNLAYFYARVLSAPWRNKTYHYNDEDSLAIDLFRAARDQGVELTEEDSDLLQFWTERFLPTNRRTLRLRERYGTTAS